jgi:hypothetical protein
VVPEFQTKSINTAARLFMCRFEYESGRFGVTYPLLRVVIGDGQTIFVLSNRRGGAAEIANTPAPNPDSFLRALRRLQQAERSARQLRLFGEAVS